MDETKKRKISLISLLLVYNLAGNVLERVQLFIFCKETLVYKNYDEITEKSGKKMSWSTNIQT